MDTKYTIVAVVLLALAAGATATVVTATTATAQQEGTATVTFENQSTDGTTVTVDSATLSNGGFLVIHNASLEDGDAVGSVVGASEYLEPGVQENVTIELSTPVSEDQRLIAMAHGDTNGNETYDFVTTNGSADGPYLGETGEAVTDDATVTVEAEPTEPEQPTEQPTEEPTEEEPTEPTEEEPTDEPTEQPTEEPTEEAPTEEPTEEEPTDEPTEQPTEEPTEEEPTDEPTEQPTEEPGEPAEPAEPAEPGEPGEPAEPAEPAEPTEPEAPEEPADFEVTNLTAPANASVGDVVNVSARVTNPGNVSATETVDFRFQGRVLARSDVELDAGESTQVTFDVDTSAVEAGSYYHAVFAESSGQVAQLNVSESFVVESLDAPENVTVGENVTVDAEIGNPNDFEATQPVQFRIAGMLVAQQSVTIDADSDEDITFEVNTSGVPAGTYVHGVFTDRNGTFAVITLDEAPEEEPTEEPTEEEPTEEESTEEPTEEEPTEQPAEEEPTDEESTEESTEDAPTDEEPTDEELTEEETPTDGTDEEADGEDDEAADRTETVTP